MTDRYALFIADIARTDQNILIITVFVLAGLLAWWVLGGLSVWPRLERIVKGLYMAFVLGAFIASMMIA